LGEQPGAGAAEAAGGAEQDGDRPGVGVAQVLAWGADGQVPEGVAVELARHQGRPEAVAVLRDTRHAGGVLGQDLAV
jgi:hypothetical protein